MTENEDFELLLEQSFQDEIVFSKGDEVSGKIFEENEDLVFISCGINRQDIIAFKKDYLDEEGNFNYKIGDEIKGYIAKISDSEIIVVKSLNDENSKRENLREAFEKNVLINGKVLGEIKGGFRVETLGVKAFCPFSHMSLNRTEENFVGKNFDFEIIKFEDRNVVVSRKNILQQAQKEKKEKALKNIKVGDQVKGKIVKILNSGAIVDLKDISAFIHISNISWLKIKKIEDVLKVNDEISAIIISMENDKISLSMKALQENPLIKALENIKEGNNYTCRVIENKATISIVELLDNQGVTGIIPISELAYGRKIKSPSEVLKKGSVIDAQVIKLDKEKKQVVLSLKALIDNPWDDYEKYAKKGELVSGTIEKISPFGIFIKIADGMVGLMHKSTYLDTKLVFDENDLGKPIKAKVIDIDEKNQKLSLAPEYLTKNVENIRNEAENSKVSLKEVSWQDYAKDEIKKEDFNDFKDL